jgi:hypothetical protein
MSVVELDEGGVRLIGPRRRCRGGEAVGGARVLIPVI